MNSSTSSFVMSRDLLLAEERRDVDAEVALIADGGRRLPAPRDQLLDQPLARLLDRHPLIHRRDGDLGHQLAQPGLGHLPGQAVAAARRADRPELARDRPVPDAPLAIPGVALLEDAAGAVLALPGAGWLGLGGPLRRHALLYTPTPEAGAPRWPLRSSALHESRNARPRAGPLRPTTSTSPPGHCGSDLRTTRPAPWPRPSFPARS